VTSAILEYYIDLSAAEARIASLGGAIDQVTFRG
jgi:hypothetical protein